MDNKTIYKCPRGTRDCSNGSQALRQSLIDKCIQQFKLFGAKQIDTPAFEREDVLMEKYNDDNQKEIFRLVPEGNTEESESLALRYDLTVPFSRYVKMNSIKKIRRFQIGKVWRQDQPNMKTGRFREFTQADYDYADVQCDMELADAETVALLISILDLTAGPNYTIRLNDRNLLYRLLEHCEVPENLYQTVCSSIDKLDKKKWKAIVPELIQKGLDLEVIDKLRSELAGYKTVTLKTLADVVFVTPEISERFQKIYEYLQILCPKQIGSISIDFTMARGLDYYTGIIFEVVHNNKKKIGSIAGGGRYDKLCGVPCVGFSVGIDRILASLQPWPKRKYNPTVWVIQIDIEDRFTENGQTDGPTENEPTENEPTENEPTENRPTNKQLYEYRLKILTAFRERGINAATEMRLKTGMGPEMKYVLKNEIPYVVFVGSTEISCNKITFKDMDNKKQYDNITVDEAVRLIK